MRKYFIAAIPVILLLSCAIQLACGGGSSTQPPMTYDPARSPSGFEWSVGSEKIFLNWGAVPFAAGYKVYLSANGVDFGLYSGASLVPTNSIIITEVTNAKPYFVGVSAVGTSSVESAIGYPGGAPDAVPIIPTSVAPDKYLGVAPAAPKNLQGFAGDQFVQLDWDENEEPDLKDYFVSLRRESAIKFSVYPAVTSNSFTHNDAQNGVTYFYKVRARDKELLISEYSNIVYYTPQSSPPLAPTGFTAAYSFAEGGVVLNWDIPSEADVVAYRLIRYDYTDGIVDPLFDTSIVTLSYPRTRNPYDPGPDEDPNYIWIPPFVDKFAMHGAIYIYELAAIDSEGQIGPPTLTPEVIVPE